MATNIGWECSVLANWAKGKLVASEAENRLVVQGFSTDSRSIEKGDCYIAIRGMHFDGHQFVDQAIEAGAAALIVSQKMDVRVPQIIVKDTRIALADIAEQHRLNQPDLILIAITGSNGKTTVKSMLAHCLSQYAPTWATPGNLNNDYGVPRTLLQIRPEHRYAVIEMGANHRGEIGYLTRIAHPDIALITLAADAHLEGFGSLQGIIDTKGEIFHGLKPQGIGMINTDSPGFDQWQQTLANKGCKTFGTRDIANVKPSQIRQDANQLAFVLQFDYANQSVNLPISLSMLGQHNALNAAAVATICLALGLTPDQIKRGLETFNGVSGRLQRHQLGQVLLIDDSYNANPSSVKAAIDTLVALPGKRILCLGQMAELGEVALQAHSEIGRYAAQQQIDYLFGFGELTALSLIAFAEGRSQAVTEPRSHQALADSLLALVSTIEEPITVLVKGSRSSQMEQVVKNLLQRMSHADLS